VSDLFAGAGYLLRGLRLVRMHGVPRYVIIPLAINTLLFAGASYLAFDWFGVLMQHLAHELPQWLEWLRYVLWALFVAAGLLILYFAFGVLANLIAAPFNGLLSARVERLLTGRRPGEDDGADEGLLRGAWRDIRAQLIQLRYVLLRLALLGALTWILALIPPVNLLIPFLWFAFGAWMNALGYVDVPMGNHGIAFPRGRRIMARHRGLALGFGSVTTLAGSLPLINFFVIPVAVAGATAMWVERLQDTPGARR